ncbi:hypothetical protein GCM10023093_04350 [Nemorincola caseinilytica]|uniref:Secretion system C-terminal sorting domain-containing protein n=1 Tax=Nemorincola caseinilytica TaxID=2054315 RepID=A0ABP8N3U9_9BACT
MLRPLLVSASLLAATTSFAQATLTGDNFNPHIGEAFQLRICDTTGITPGPAGASITWNFATGANGLTVTSVDTGRAVSCLSTPYFSNYPTATIALKGPSITADATTYLIANSTRLAQLGYYASPDTNLILTNAADQIRYPFTYPNTFTDTYEGTFHLNPLTAHHTGTITVTCDGWGTLQLPGRTDNNVLRVKTTQTFTDSANVFGTPIMKTYEILSYDWYKPDYHTALLTIQTVTEVGSPTPDYRFIAFAGMQITGVPDMDPTLADVQLFPTPATGELNITFSTPVTQHVRITLHDMAGREIAAIADGKYSGKQQLRYNTADLARGLYFVSVHTDAGSVTKKVVLE